KHNLYTFSLNELALKGPLTCLIAKASQAESTLWHRRLGHVNFKNINKLGTGDQAHDKTPYELLTGDKPSISYLKPFGCHVTILNTSDPLGKFDKKSDEGYIVGYSISIKAYIVYNLVSRKIEETMNLKFLENKPFVARTSQAWMFNIDYLTDSLNYSRVSSTNLTAGSQGATPSNADNLDELAELQALPRQEQAGTEEADRLGLAFPSLNPILGVGSAFIGSSIYAGSTPPVSAGSTPPMFLCASPISANRHFISAGKSHVSAGRPSGSADRTPVPAGRILESLLQVHPLNDFHELLVWKIQIFMMALADPDWVEAMQAEMQQFKNQKVWVLVTLPDGKWDIGTKWILKNKRDARGIVCRNKARLVAQGHRQEKGIDYSDVFALVARIEAIRLFLAFASFMGFRVYQMDVKSAFLYGKIAEEVYVTQPRGFEDPDHPKKVYKVVKALYGLHHAPSAWYERLSTFLLKRGYRRGTIEKTLFIKKDSKDIMLVQVYVDDMIFGSTRKDWCEEFEMLIQSEFEMSSMGPPHFLSRVTS
nr:putative ribonuclease H-like domain-containing protein [Tanacetum cinerariifolium]